jgi:hypothetical protein
MRFVALQDPTDNWMVYDMLFGIPAEVAGKVLYGLTQEDALTNQLNVEFRSETAIPPSSASPSNMRLA